MIPWRQRGCFVDLQSYTVSQRMTEPLIQILLFQIFSGLLIHICCYKASPEYLFDMLIASQHRIIDVALPL